MDRLLNVVSKLKILDERKSPFCDSIKEMIAYSDNMLKEIKTTFDNYTNHDIGHSFNVIKYMCDAVSDLNELSDLEITVIIFVGLLHDIGMVVSKEEKETIKKDGYALSRYNFVSVLNNCNGNETLAIQEIVRPIHALRSQEHISTKMSDKKSLFRVPGINGIYFDKIVGEICIAHNEEFEWIKLNLSSNVVLGEYSLNPQYIAVLLRLADLLDVDSSRAPDYLYKLIAPTGIGDDEWKQHFIITNSNKIKDTDKNVKYIEFYGETADAKIHRKLLNYIDWIKKEVENATAFLNENPMGKYHLNISTNIQNHIKPRSFEFSNFKLSLDFKSITNLLMGENIYNDKKCGLREIIQNSIDACKLMKEESRYLEEYKYNDYQPEIVIRIDSSKKSVSIFDNGIGMSFDIIKKYFLNVGVSYYNSKDCKYRGYSYVPIGNYGIGFLACFMLSNNVQIKSKRFDQADTIIVDIEKDNEYVVFSKSSERRSSFTEIILDETFFEVFPTVELVKSYIEETFLDSSISIRIQKVESNNEFEKIKCDLLSLTSEEKDDICLNKYLKDIEAYIMMNRNIDFIQSLDDISYTNNYIYENGKLSKYDSSKHNIDNFISNNQLNFATITFIPNSMQEKFNSYCEALDDYADAIEKIGDLDRINIFYNRSTTVLLAEDEHIIVDLDYTAPAKSYDINIFANLSVYELLEQIDNYDLTDCDLYSLYICDDYHSIVGSKENNYLTFWNDWYAYWQSKEKRRLFVRNVLINRYNFQLPVIISGVKINEMIVNVLNKNIIPDISRSNIQENITKQINSALGKALHLWMFENITTSFEEKEVIKEFINLEYGVYNPFVAEIYNKELV